MGLTERDKPNYVARSGWAVATAGPDGSLELDWDGKLHESVDEAVYQLQEARGNAGQDAHLIHWEVVS